MADLLTIAKEAVPTLGGRKFILGMIYLIGCFVTINLALWKGLSGWDSVAVGSMCVSIATGLGVVVWGNVQAGKNGNGGERPK